MSKRRRRKGGGGGSGGGGGGGGGGHHRNHHHAYEQPTGIVPTDEQLELELAEFEKEWKAIAEAG